MKRRVLDWKNRRSWLVSIRHYAPHLLTSSLRLNLETRRPECWSDNFSWLPDAEYILPDFVSCLTNYYTHFKAYHGCRPIDLASYYDKGLIGQNSEQLCSTFKQIFSDVPADDVEIAISRFLERGSQERGAIWLLADDRFLINYCGHYLIQGSEYLMALAANLGPSTNGEDYRFRLREYGIPTVLEVDIPISLVPGTQHVEVAKMILSEWGQLAARRTLGIGEDPPCYVIRHNIPAAYIQGHSHPEKIPDPHQGHRIYTNKKLTCEKCR